MFRGHADASWGLKSQSERNQKTVQLCGKASKHVEPKFDLGTQTATDRTPEGIAQYIAQYEARGDTRIVNFYLDIDLALQKAKPMHAGEIAYETNGAIWALNKGRLVERLRKWYPQEDSRSECSLCINHALEVCARIGRNDNGTKGIIIPLVVNDYCFLIPSGSNNFSENLEAAVGCNFDNIAKDEKEMNVQMEDVLTMRSCVLMKIVIVGNLMRKM